MNFECSNIKESALGLLGQINRSIKRHARLFDESNFRIVRVLSCGIKLRIDKTATIPILDEFDQLRCPKVFVKENDSAHFL